MSEQKAEGLYGPAPTGDEEPTANQYPSDPGETSRPQIPFSAALLDGTHLGRTVRVTDKDTSITGMLAGVKHSAPVIVDSTLFGPPSYGLGQRTVELRFTNGYLKVMTSAIVVVLD